MSYPEKVTDLKPEEPIAWETEDDETILVHIDINGRAHYPSSKPKPKITRTKDGHYDCRV